MREYTFTSDKRDHPFGGWTRTVKIGEQEYSLSVCAGKRVRIAFKPRGQNRGYHWNGAVYRIGSNAGCVWQGAVEGSIGCRGLLRNAGLL